MSEVNQSELVAVFSGAAVFSNRFNIAISSIGVRIAFMEHFLESMPPAFRGAFQISRADARDLHRLLGELLQKTEIH